MHGELLGLARRLERLSAARGEGAQVRELRPLTGGLSSLTYLATLACAEGTLYRAVVKIAPSGVAPVGNRDVLRQARLLKALGNCRDVSVPAVVLEDPGDPPELPPLFLMRFVPGESFEPNKDVRDGALPEAGEITARALHAARMLSALHAIPLQSIRLSAEPAIDLVAEIDRWRDALLSADSSLRDAALRIRSVLEAALPAAEPPCLLHGDYRLGNLLCESGRVTAIIDWEIWSIGDPRLDLAWFLLTADPGCHPLAIRSAAGMPSPDTLLDVYAQARSREVVALNWFRALALYKLAASVALIAKYRRRDGDRDGVAERLASRVVPALERAFALASAA